MSQNCAQQGAKMGSRGGVVKNAQKYSKHVKNKKNPTHVEGYFCYFSALLGNHFSMLFGSVPFSHPLCVLGLQCGPKAPKMEPKLIQKRARRHFIECVKTIVFTVLQAHGQVLDRTLEPLFSRSQREALSQGVLRVTKGIFL